MLTNPSIGPNRVNRSIRITVREVTTGCRWNGFEVIHSFRFGQVIAVAGFVAEETKHHIAPLWQWTVGAAASIEAMRMKNYHIVGRHIETYDIP